jgi:hypothetical protein
LTGKEWARALDEAVRQHGERVTEEQVVAIAETRHPEQWASGWRDYLIREAGFELRERRKLIQFLLESPVPISVSWLNTRSSTRSSRTTPSAGITSLPPAAG